MWKGNHRVRFASTKQDTSEKLNQAISKIDGCGKELVEVEKNFKN